MRGQHSTSTEFTIGVGDNNFYMAYDEINNAHRLICAASTGVISGNLNDTSDEKLKENITSIADGEIAKIKQLRPVNFDWKDGSLNVHFQIKPRSRSWLDQANACKNRSPSRSVQKCFFGFLDDCLVFSGVGKDF